jgi:hypothetical protein
VEIEQIAPHLWWWTAPHPDWGPDDFKDGQGWARDVSSYALVEDDDLVLFDPLVPTGDEPRFWAALDGDVEQLGPPAILLTVFWHARSSRQILDRYEGTAIWAHEPSLEEVSKRVPVTNTFVHADELPGRVEALAMHHMDEAAFWLPSHKAIVFGDTLLGYDEGVRHCPESWLREGESFTSSKTRLERVVNGKRPRLYLLTHGGPRGQRSEL